MFEWNINVQRMIDFIEVHISREISLKDIANHIGYSEFYCTKQFHIVADISLKSYIRLRRLSLSAIDLRDTDMKIIDIAIKYCFSSHEAFTRSFKKAYHITPAEYRRKCEPLPLLLKRNTFNPYFFGLGEMGMDKSGYKGVTISIKKVAAHKLICIKNSRADNYFGFWELQEKIPGQDCHTVCGILESIPSLGGQIGGWYKEDGKTGYLYGIEVPDNYDGVIPEGMEVIDIPENDYVEFYHPPYDYNSINSTVMNNVHLEESNWDVHKNGYAYIEDLPVYQRSDPEKFGYSLCKPIKLIV